MSDMYGRPLDEQLFHRYLEVLGVSVKAPDLNVLRQLIAAHLSRIPFENMSKLYYRKHKGLLSLPGLQLYLDGIENFNFGGTCYSNNYYFNLLLGFVGYDAKLCGAGMTNPDVHIVNIVTLDGREYLVDVGYAAPFLKPLPRDLDRTYVVALGRDRFELKPQDEQHRSRIDMYRDNKLIHGYTVKPIPRPIRHFEKVIAGSFSEDATFMNALLLARFYKDQSVAIHNYELIESKGTDYRIFELETNRELAHTIVDRFSIPREVVEDVLADMVQMSGNAWA
jgi:N-hydroxyarylamine O-acetyltransferase